MCGNLNTHKLFQIKLSFSDIKSLGESQIIIQILKKEDKQIKRSQSFQTMNLCQIQMYT